MLLTRLLPLTPVIESLWGLELGEHVENHAQSRTAEPGNVSCVGGQKVRQLVGGSLVEIDGVLAEH